MKYRAICFDFDYTLGDDTEAIVAGYTYAFEKLGWPQPQRDEVRHQVGYALEDGYSNLTGDRDTEKRKEFRRFYLERALDMQKKSTPLLPGAKELLQGLFDRDIPVAIVSTKGTAVLESILERHGVLKDLAFVIGGDQVHVPKPDPQGLNTAVERLGLTKDEVLFCGDTIIDAETAQRAGVDFCAVLCGTTKAEAFVPFPKVFVANDLFALADFFAQ